MLRKKAGTRKKLPHFFQIFKLQQKMAKAY
jgi:hypothetical protein